MGVELPPRLKMPGLPDATPMELRQWFEQATYAINWWGSRGNVGAYSVGTAAVGSSALQPGAVGSVAMGPNSVGSTNLQAGAVNTTNNALADNTVATQKVIANAITLPGSLYVPSIGVINNNATYTSASVSLTLTGLPVFALVLIDDAATVAAVAGVGLAANVDLRILANGSIIQQNTAVYVNGDKLRVTLACAYAGLLAAGSTNFQFQIRNGGTNQNISFLGGTLFVIETKR